MQPPAETWCAAGVRPELRTELLAVQLTPPATLRVADSHPGGADCHETAQPGPEEDSRAGVGFEPTTSSK